jgi:hypothetical protein
MDLDFAFLADAAVVDGSGKLSVLGVFDRIRAREFPARHGRIALVMRLAASPEDEGEHKVEIRLRSPDDHDVLRLDGQVRVGPAPQTQGMTRIAQVLNLDGVVFPRAGRYRFEIRIDDQLAAPVPLVLEGVEGREIGPAGPFGTTGPEGVPIVFAPGGPAEA